MALKSTRDDYQVRHKAQHFYRCEGDGKMVRSFSPLCTRNINRGDEYVVRVTLAPHGRATPRMYTDASRHCAHCALAFIPQIVIVPEAA